MIFYVSRGLLTHLTDGVSVMTKIAEENLRTNFEVEIHTFPVWDCCKTMMLETAFLSDIAQQNFSKFTLSFNKDLQAKLKTRSPTEVREGMMTLVNTSADNCLDFKDVLKIFSLGNVKVAQPSDHEVFNIALTEDFSSKKSTLVSLNTLVYANANLIGILGLDADLADLTAPVIFYNSADSSSSAFLIDIDGFLIVHSKMTMFPNLRSIRARVTVFERRFPLKEFQKAIATKSQGELVVPSSSAVSTANIHASNSSEENENEIVFHFKKVPNTSFVVIISSRKKWTFERSHQVPFDDRVGLYLAPRGFQNSFERISTSESKRTAQGFWAFVSDMTRLITNPGLKLSVRGEIGALGKVTSEWKRLAAESPYARSVVRR
ncbi:unnamed protein product [Soboliphyme baturini]|uniref:SERPIN domain-containing protein n=1 Tax=Soboliphyme baturini TaxID=241478 RepID=A0A183J9D8_9BILA|nr:unnamed protein product [Soboliphyme baturini]